MLPLRISNATRTLAESQDEYIALTIHDEIINGVNHMTSLWEPSPIELENLLAGGAIRLTLLGRGHPPVHLTTQPPPDWNSTICKGDWSLGTACGNCAMCISTTQKAAERIKTLQETIRRLMEN